jgi:hypothetical protein
MQYARLLPYRGCFAVYRHEEPRMRQPIRSKQRDLFAAPATAPMPLPVVIRSELVSLLNALLLEVISHRRSQAHRAQQEPCHEQQDHA